MQIKEMFAKKIDREIQGVIIVGQGEDANVSQELEEYVVTRELQKHFADFYSSYKKGIVGTTPKMGVWISGFFGSGKSHFLKILSYLLENREVGGKKALDYFIDDKKIIDPMVLADMKLAAETSTDVILFNIDSKSESTGKQNKDAIVNVFLKVFNQMQGFCGSIPHVADLERRLSEEGRYEEFKAAFEEEYGEPWEASRQDFDFIQDSVVDALVSMEFMSEVAARNWCEKAVEPYTISIEGKSLSNVVIFRLPFPVPDPIINYKASIAKDALMDVNVPEMVIKLKQGIGRLIRNFTDTGIVCIIDRRLRDEPAERYHDITWSSLPIKNRTKSLDELRRFYNSLPAAHNETER